MLLMTLVQSGCASDLPEDIRDYDTRCVSIATAGPYKGDPHSGNKRIFACNVELAALQAGTRPFPDGTIIVKESTKPGKCDPWLIATMRKKAGKWSWEEFTRNFADEDYGELLVPESTCTNCHKDAEEVDWVFSQFSAIATTAKICPPQ